MYLGHTHESHWYSSVSTKTCRLAIQGGGALGPYNRGKLSYAMLSLPKIIICPCASNWGVEEGICAHVHLSAFWALGVNN